MTIHAYQYDDTKELNKFFRETHNISETDYRIMELEHTKSKKGKIKFVNTNHKATQQRMLKKFLLLFAIVIVYFIIMNQFDIKFHSELFQTILQGFIIVPIIFIAIWFFKLITLSKSVIFEKNTIYSPMIIGSHFLADFDEIQIKKNENFIYTIFNYKNKPTKKNIVLIADNEERKKSMIDFAQGYAEKANKKLTNEL